GRALDGLRVRVPEDERPDRVIHEEELVDAAAPLEPGARALVAALGLVERRAYAGDDRVEDVGLLDEAREVARVGNRPTLLAHEQALGVEAELVQLEVLGGVRLLAGGAQDAHEPLR